MANLDRPNGLEPLNNVTSGDFSAKIQPYYVPSSDATALFVGDPVVKTGTSNTSEIDGFQPGTLPEVARTTAGAGNASTGVIVSFGPDRDDLTNQYRVASTERIVYVLDDPYASFRIQDDASATLDAGAVGNNANIVFTTGGSTAYGRSGAELQASSVASGATLQLKILRLLPREDNAVGANAIWEVRLNNHTESPNSAGV